MTTIAGIFENQTVAQQAVQQLEKAGYARRDDITLVTGSSNEERDVQSTMQQSGFSQDLAHVYQEAVQRGDTLVIVQTNPQNAEQIRESLQETGAVDRVMPDGSTYKPATPPQTGEEQTNEASTQSDNTAGMQRENYVDRTIEGSFPASDPPPWTASGEKKA
jgi:hypothetical protein